MNKLFKAFSVAVLLVASISIVSVFAGCAASKEQIAQATGSRDIMVEVRSLGKDSVSWFAGNTMYLNLNVTRKQDWFPMFISIRNPNNIDVQRGIEQVASSWELITFFKKYEWEAKNFGIVISDLINNEIGVDEKGIVDKLTAIFRQVEGSSLVIFYEKDGVVNSMKKIY